LLPSEHYRTITAVKLQKPLPIIDRLSEKTKHKIDIEQPIYGVIDGAHRLHVIQELCFSGEDPTNFPEAGLQISVMVPCDEGKVWDMLSLVSAAHSSSLASAAFRVRHGLIESLGQFVFLKFKILLTLTGGKSLRIKIVSPDFCLILHRSVIISIIYL